MKIILPLRLLLAAALLAGAFWPMLAQARNNCYDYSRSASVQGTQAINWCIRRLSDGMAAVQLPGADKDIDDVAASRSDDRYAWGFLDKAGQLAVKPQYDKVMDFRNGYAAVHQDGQWGFIDRKGHRVVEPQYPHLLMDFTQAGLALVKNGDGAYVFIDTNGQSVGPKELAHATRVRLSGGDPARVKIDYAPVLLGANGQKIDLPAGVKLSRQFGDKRYIAYSDKAGAYGIIDHKLNWVVKPRFDHIRRRRRGQYNVALARKENDRSVVITPDGTMRRIGNARSRGAFWVTRSDDSFTVYWPDGRKVGQFSLSSGVKFHRLYPFLALQGDKQTEVYSSKHNKPVQVSAEWAPMTLKKKVPLLALVKTGNRLSRYRNGPTSIQALVTLSGDVLDPANGQAWVKQVKASRTRQAGGYILLRDEHAHALQILGHDGTPLLSGDAVKKLHGYKVKLLPTIQLSPATQNGKPLPIAFINPPHCCSKRKGAGLVMSDGTIQLHDNWAQLSSMDEDLRSAYRQDTPLPANTRFRVKTAKGKYGIVDASGQVIVSPQLDKLGDYHADFVLGYAGGKPTIYDRGGKAHSAPMLFQADLLGEGMLGYTDSARANAGRKLYNIKTGQTVGGREFETIGTFKAGLARAQSSQGRYGVITTQGQWVIPAEYKQLKRVGKNFWYAGPEPDADEEGPRKLLGPDGKTLVATSRLLTTHVYSNGLLKAAIRPDRYKTPDKAWLYNDKGDQVAAGRKIRFTSKGTWVKEKRPGKIGFMSGDGQWVIPPQLEDIGSFHADTGLALRHGDSEQSDALVNKQGKVTASLPGKANWQWPLHTSKPYRHVVGKDDPKTEYANTQGQVIASAAGYGQPLHHGRAVFSQKGKAPFTWVGSEGKRDQAIRFPVLGPLQDGRAVAGHDRALGLIDEHGRFVIPPVFRALSVSGGGIVASTRDQSMILNAAGRPVVRTVQRCHIRLLYSASNRLLWPQELPSGCDAAR